ncbi:MAG: FAD-binding oxidoreductase [Chloroflexi bacterium]|nr:FAD-binding oxidoreductase [Chloroflexota bacterium]
MLIPETSLWSATAPPLKSFAHRPLPAKADVVVIGGGYTGVSAALKLAKHGAAVTLLEGETLGWGASSRNGGQVLVGHKHGVEDLVRQFGKERARELYQASIKTIECVEQIIEEEKIDCDYVRCGYLEAAAKPAHFDSLKRAQEVLERDFGHTTRALPKAEMKAELGAEFYHGVLVDERSGGLHPAKFINGLALAAERAGADLHESTPAASLEKRANGGFTVKTDRGSIEAKEVFVATNGYTGKATPIFQRRIIPIGSYIIATEPLDSQISNSLIPNRRVAFDTKNFLHYFRLSPDNRMVFGGRAAFSPETPNTVRESAEILRREMIAAFPELRDTPVAYAWGGTLGFTFDLYPHAGQMDGLWYAMGYAGHGVAMATFLGQQMADRIAGRGGYNPFEGMAFPTMPLYNGKPWFLPLAAVWYRLLDLIS